MARRLTITPNDSSCSPRSNLVRHIVSMMEELEKFSRYGGIALTAINKHVVHGQV